MTFSPFVYWGVTIYAGSFQTTSTRRKGHHMLSSTLHLHHITAADSVWAFPFSIASTRGISFDFSSTWYSDASFPTVRYPNLQEGIVKGLLPSREVTFGHPRIEDCMRLPEAYRSLPRPSSPLKPSHPPDGVVAPIGSDTLRLARSYTRR